MKTYLTTLVAVVAVAAALTPEVGSAQSSRGRGNQHAQQNRGNNAENRGAAGNNRQGNPHFFPPWFRPDRPPKHKPAPPEQPPTPPQGPTRLGDLLVDGNTVWRELRQGTPGKIQIRLGVSENITWWKGIKIIDAQGRETWLELQDRPGGFTATATFDRNDFGQAVRVEFWKAKGLNYHLYQTYTVINAGVLEGRLLTFSWRTDN